MNPKSVFLEDKELAKWWVNIARDSRFEKVAVLAVARLAITSILPNRVEGGIAILDIMREFTDPDPTSPPFPSPGLIHETPKRITETDKPKA